MSLGAYLRDSSPWHRRCADVVDAIRSLYGPTTTHSTNAYTVVTSIKTVALLDGEIIRFIPDAANTGAATLAINDPDGNVTVAAKSIKRANGSTALVAGDLPAAPVWVQYDLANDVYRLVLTASASAPILVAGTYTPTLSNVANLDASTAYLAIWTQVGNVVSVGFRVDVDPTTGAAQVQLGISLPVASNLTALEDCCGSAAAPGIVSMSGGVFADTTNDRAQLTFDATSTGNNGMFGNFTYLVK